MIATNIEWEVDFEEDLKSLPEEIVIPEEIEEEDIADYISDKTGYLHNGFQITK